MIGNDGANRISGRICELNLLFLRIKSWVNWDVLFFSMIVDSGVADQADLSET
jgi:hypothetical protein